MIAKISGHNKISAQTQDNENWKFIKSKVPITNKIFFQSSLLRERKQKLLNKYSFVYLFLSLLKLRRIHTTQYTLSLFLFWLLLLFFFFIYFCCPWIIYFADFSQIRHRKQHRYHQLSPHVKSFECILSHKQFTKRLYFAFDAYRTSFNWYLISKRNN